MNLQHEPWNDLSCCEQFFWVFVWHSRLIPYAKTAKSLPVTPSSGDHTV